MAKLYQQLEALFKYRCNSNSEIIPYIKKLSEAGKFDEPKKVAVFAIILDRLGKMEDEALIQESLKTDTTLIGGNGSDGEGNDETIANLPTANVTDVEGETELKVVPEIPAVTEATTSPDASTEPEVIPEAQTPVETTPEVPTDPTTPVVTPEVPAVDANADETNNTISEFSLEAVAEKPTPPEVDPTTSA